MFLVVTATELEMRPITARLAAIPGWLPLVAGVGPLETAVTLTRHLAASRAPFTGIVNCGVAGAFVGAGPSVLDICLAEQEVQADIGIAMPGGIQEFDTLEVPVRFPLDGRLRDRALAIFSRHGTPAWSGPFVSVSAVSGTEARGESLRKRYRALCENMEGAAVARVAREFGLPCLEIRAISNLVEDRDPGTWRLPQACQRLAEALAILVPGLKEQP